MGVLAQKVEEPILRPRTNGISTMVVDVIRRAPYSSRPAGYTGIRSVPKDVDEVAFNRDGILDFVCYFRYPAEGGPSYD